ncbi:unnamed protein product [Oppiella nova]|uniref:NR LBD domain-containing protein n=1 Tax=Oppiella nova TaxID=334625 RepID=A0A7R9QSM6_9ACAR|nr:unnamed protein product [Oppiella nova]CAG2173925.1 unnamed protein product [Oppiella nova]
MNGNKLQKQIQLIVSDLGDNQEIMSYTKLNNENSFNELESNRLSELFKASQVFRYKTIQNKSLNEIINLTEVNDMCNMMLDLDVLDLIQFTKSLTSFKNMCFNDQMALFKYGCLEMLILRCSIFYDTSTQYWKWVWNRENPFVAEQQLYIYLLQRYLYLRYRSEVETHMKLAKLMDPLKDLQIICDIKKKKGYELYMDTFGPNLKEILYDTTL